MRTPAPRTVISLAVFSMLLTACASIEDAPPARSIDPMPGLGTSTLKVTARDEQARAWFNDDNGLPALGYDPNIAKALSVTDGPIPELWPQFGALAQRRQIGRRLPVHARIAVDSLRFGLRTCWRG